MESAPPMSVLYFYYVILDCIIMYLLFIIVLFILCYYIYSLAFRTHVSSCVRAEINHS
jgi:hypothetical protein